MFPAEKKGEWEPYRVREKKSQRASENGINGPSSEVKDDVHMVDGDGAAADEQPKADNTEDDVLYEEDPSSDEGAVYPLREGRVVNWSCFFALLTHVYNTLSPPFHTPILLISQPAWTAQDHEILTQFFFEKFKTPAFCLMDSALAVSYAYGVPTATIVDVGHGKCDVSAVSDFMVYDIGRGAGVPGCGGESMTERLFELLSPIGFTWEMCEQLKKSNICEILPQGTPLPGSTGTEEQVTNPAAAASTGAMGSGPRQRGSIAAQGGAPRGPGVDTEVGDEDQDREMKDGEDNEGVLDVASIVASGKTNEFLAKKEREKAEKAAARKAAVDAAAAPKPVRLPNSKREKTTFHYDERRPLEDINENGKRQADTENGHEGSDFKRQKTPDPLNESAPSATDETTTKDADIAKRQQDKAARKEERRRNRDGNSAFVRKEIEVGVERFMAASGGVLEQMADTIHRTILSVPEVAKRSELWDSLVILGNGSKVRGTLLPLPTPQIIPIQTPKVIANDKPPYPPRVQRRAPRNPPCEIPHLPLLRHNLHLRTPLQPLHPPRHRRKHPPTPIPIPIPTPTRHLFAQRKSPPPSRNNRLKPLLTPIHPPTTTTTPAKLRFTWSQSFEPRPDANEHQGSEDARIFPRMEGRGVRRGRVFGRAGGGQGRLCGRSGVE